MKFSKEFKLGLFVLVIIILTLVTLNVLRGVDIFGREKSISGRFDDVESLESSAPVHIKGYKAGQVTAIEYDPSCGNFIVKCNIKKEFNVPVDSKMVIYSTNIMGTKGVRIDLGTSAESAQDASFIKTGYSKDMLSALYDGFNPFVDKLSKIADSINVTIAGVNNILNADNRANIAVTLKHIRSTIEKADKMVGEIGSSSDEITSIINNLNNISSKIAPLVDSASATISNVNAITASLSEADLKSTMGKVDSAVENIDKAVVKISQPLDSLLNDVDSLVNAIKANPKKYIKVTIF